MTLEQTLSQIKGADETIYQKALAQWDGLAKPLGSLGSLETAIARIAAITGTAEVSLKKRRLVVLCADNGVICQGVSQSDESVTRAVTSALGEGTSTVNYMARQAACEVLPVDFGVKDFSPHSGVLSRRVRNGTADISTGPAMSREECLQAVQTGLALARQAKEAGMDILLTGEMGIGNTTTSCAVASVLLGQDPGLLVGRGAGLSDAGLVRKTAAIRRAIAVNDPNPTDPLDVLHKVGGLDLAGLCGLCLGGAFTGLPVLLDGFISCVAALCAVRLCPKAGDALLASHLSAEPGAKRVLEALGLTGFLQAGLHLGEGTGAVAALPLLDVALAVYRSGHTFHTMGLTPYTPQ